MADFVDNTVRDIDNRLRELRDEVARLEAARAALRGGRGSAGGRVGSSQLATRRPSRDSTRRPRRARARRRTRAAQALQIVQSQPGITLPEIAEAMKIEPNYLYRVLPRLARQGLVEREGQGWRPSPGPPVTNGDEDG